MAITTNTLSQNPPLHRTRKRTFDPHVLTWDAPRELTLEDCNEFPSKDRYIPFIKTNGKVVVTQNESGGYTAIAYNKNGQTCYQEELDKNYQVLVQKHLLGS